MKTRDIIKYAFASFIALATLVGIVGMQIAKHRRAQLSEDEAARIRQMLMTNQQGSQLPAPIPTPDPNAVETH